ncbi:MAG TPA: STAS domain-containing protein [Vicinamibacterales bacterium]|nr:STAS domain-containing protein [Vicinamibacterales bacterium]
MPSLLPQRPDARELVLSPQEHLVAGGPAEQLEQLIQTSFRGGAHRIFVDLRAVPLIDSAGVRALVRGHTSAQRLGRHFCLVAPNASVLEVLRVANLEKIFTICDSVTTARARPWPWKRILTTVGVVVVGVGLVVTGHWWPLAGGAEVVGQNPLAPGASVTGSWDAPLFELAKLIVAAIVGMLVTIVQRHYRSDRTANPTLEQAQVLLCISGALMMIIIGSSLARAFGIAGAASIIRFRTPVEDARDITVLFILMGLGMAAGLGGFAVAGLGTLFLCAMFPILNVFAADRPRTMMVEIAAEGREFPMDHVQKVFARNQVVFEPREVEQGDEATVRYLTALAPHDSLEDLSNQLMDGGKAGIKNVSWSPPKRF